MRMPTPAHRTSKGTGVPSRMKVDNASMRAPPPPGQCPPRTCGVCVIVSASADGLVNWQVGYFFLLAFKDCRRAHVERTDRRIANSDAPTSFDQHCPATSAAPGSCKSLRVGCTRRRRLAPGRKRPGTDRGSSPNSARIRRGRVRRLRTPPCR